MKLSIKPIKDTAIPSILTTSFREILSYYNKKIVEIEASGGWQGKNKISIDDLYGIWINAPGISMMEVKYHQMREGGKIINPLNKEKIKHICDEIDLKLKPYHDDETDNTYKPDLSVSRMIIESEDNELMKTASTNTNVFDLTFVSDAVEESKRALTRDLNMDKGLHKKQRFKIRNLNLHKIEECVQKFSGENKNKIMAWDGPSDLYPKSPYRIAQIVIKNHIPSKYAYFKIYGITPKDELVLLEEDNK